MKPRGLHHHHHHHHHRHALDSCTLQLHNWNPFHPSSKTLTPRPKKPCLSDRSTAPNSPCAAALDLSRLTLLDDPNPAPPPLHGVPRWLVARKRRRRGSRSVSGRSSDRSATRRGTCSDLPLAAGGTCTDSGEGSWGSDASEARVPRRDVREFGGLERELSGSGTYQGAGAPDAMGNESGYGSEPGYRGDAEIGYGDEIDEEEDAKMMFWGHQMGDPNQMEIVGENKFSEQKSHHRGRRKKHDWRMMSS